MYKLEVIIRGIAPSQICRHMYRVIKYITLCRLLCASWIQTENLIPLHIKLYDCDFLCREKAKKALWFAETYGVLPISLQMEDSTGQEVNINLTEEGNKNQGDLGSLCMFSFTIHIPNHAIWQWLTEIPSTAQTFENNRKVDFYCV